MLVLFTPKVGIFQAAMALKLNMFTDEVTMKWLILALAVGFSGCASVETCPSASEEPVSMCRARYACGGSSSGKKALTAIGILLSGAGAGANGTNLAAKNHEDCIENNLSAQRANAGIPSNDVKCESERISDTQVITKCRAI